MACSLTEYLASLATKISYAGEKMTLHPNLFKLSISFDGLCVSICSKKWIHSFCFKNSPLSLKLLNKSLILKSFLLMDSTPVAFAHNSAAASVSSLPC